MATAQTRLYIIRSKTDKTAAPRPVKAPNSAQALRHVAVDTLSVSVPTQDELIAAVRAGVVPEVSGQATADEGGAA